MAAQRQGDEKGGRWVWWAVFAVVSVGCGIFAVEMFPEAFPMASLTISMQRPHALHSALNLSSELGWLPAAQNGSAREAGGGWQQAATFAGSEDVQNFFELEEGLQAWQRLLMGTYADNDGSTTAAAAAAAAAGRQQTLYYPYTWDVRQFREGSVTELLVSFGPDGRLCGFELTLPEDEAGHTIPHDHARQIAEATAQAAPWEVDLGLFERVESSHVKQMGGRTDHTFTYERAGLRLGREGEGRFQLTLVVGGDRLTQLTYSVKIPETFQRRFAEMRSYNTTIASVATIFMALLFILIGYGVGLFYLMRQGWVIWKPALAAGVFVGFLLLLSSVNEYPLTWMEYDTAESASTFMATNLLNSLATFVGASIWFFLSYMAAESLTRRAFPDHPQLWRFWEAAHTPAILGRVVSGYMLVSVFFAYEVGLYFFCQRKLGWWVPSSVHEHPDILATVFPWVSSIALSLQAGSWEECCFRAVPLSIAALVGRRFNKRGLCVAVAMVVQAVIFGAAHANYPSMPSWARLVELIIPSLMFGGVYLQYGLVPSIVLHFVFDVVWFALPLFASPSRFDQGLVILCALAPLWLVLAKRFILKGSAHVSNAAPPLNRDWKPPVAHGNGAESAAAAARRQLARPVIRVRVPPSVVVLVVVLAAAGLGVWAYGHGFPAPASDAPALHVTRAQAIALAKSELLARYANSDANSDTHSDANSDDRVDIRNVVERWYVIATVDEGDCGEAEGAFVWETTAGDDRREAYGRVAAAGFLEPPQWRVRFVQFDVHEPDVAARAERYAVAVTPLDADAGVRRVAHRLPESSLGANLTRDAAQLIARRHARRLVGHDKNADNGDDKNGKNADNGDDGLVLVSSSSERLPNRVDWIFTFAARPAIGAVVLAQGEPRVVVNVSGDAVTDHHRLVHVPEEWRRERQNAEATLDVVRFACTALVAMAFGAAVVVALVRWSTAGAIDHGVFARVYGLLLVVFVLTWLNNFPTAVEARLDTSQPLYHQLLVRAGVGLLKSALLPFGLALVLAHLHHLHHHRHATDDDAPPATTLDLRSPAAKALLGGLVGVAWGGLTYGARKLALRHLFYADDPTPSCPSFAPLATYVPALDVALASLRTLFTTGLVFLLITTTADRFGLGPDRSRRRLVALLAAMVVGGAALEGASMEASATDPLRDWALPSLLFGLPLFALYAVALSKDRGLVPALAAALTLLDAGREALYAAHPGAVLGFALSVPLVALVTLLWTSALQLPTYDTTKPTTTPAAAPRTKSD